MSYPFRNLIFEGGGVKGIAYVGALRELDKRGILDPIERVGGTSAGAITAVMLALGYTTRQIQNVLWELDFNDFKDDSWGVVRDANRLMTKFGLYKGEFFRQWIGDLIKKKAGNANATFLDLQRKGFRELYVVGTNLSTGFAQVYSVEHTPRMRVADAIRISMSIPVFFAAVRNERDDVHVDGGLFNNYPVKLFDRKKYIDNAAHVRTTAYYDAENSKLAGGTSSAGYCYNRETLGFRLDSAQEIGIFRDGAEPPHTDIDHFGDYVMALAAAVINVQNNAHLHSDDWHRTVYVNTIGVGTTDFDLTITKKKELVKQGAMGVERYFEWYDAPSHDPGDAPLNKP